MAKVARDPTRLREALRRAPKPFEERLARAYDEEIDPLWGARFAELCAGGLPETVTGSVLELGCGTGLVTAELLRRHREEPDGKGKGRLVALELVPALLEHARERCREVSEGATRPAPPLFFRPHREGERLPFAEETFDLVVSNPSLGAPPIAAPALADLVRVASPGAQVTVATPLFGTWQEPLDLFDEVLRQHGSSAGRAALEEHRRSLPAGGDLGYLLEAAGLTEVTVEITRWQLLFRSGREFFYAPLIEGGPLGDWRVIAEEAAGEATPGVDPTSDDAGDEEPGAGAHALFVAWKEAIDTYFAHGVFAVSVLAARASGRKPAATTES